MTSIGLISPMSTVAKTVVETLDNQEALHKSMIHPFNVLLALTTYAAGHGVRGKLTWSPVAQVKDALDRAFLAAFRNIVPTNKNWYLGIDISGSMGSPIANTHITMAMGAAAMAMVAARTEPWFCAYGFNSSRGWDGPVVMVDLGITKQKQLSTIMRGRPRWTGGSTDCSLPFRHALQENLPVDIFAIYTDSETWHGDIHPAQALQQYREKTGRPAKLIVVGMAANNFTIADPNDSGMLDVAGFDASAPTVMANFARD
jgi:60 kDa SS-A/Ro ribonucleoprotein